MPVGPEPIALQPAAIANKTVAIAKKTTDVLKPKSILEKVIADPKEFVAEIQNLDPTALRTIITLLEDLLTTSEERETTLNDAVSDADNAVTDAANGVADAEDVLTGAQQVVADAEAHLSTTQAQAAAAIEAAEAALAHAEQEEGDAQNTLDDAKADHSQKVADREEAESNRGGELDGLNHEQQVLREVIAILEGLHRKNVPEFTCSPGQGASGSGVHAGSDNTLEGCTAFCRGKAGCVGFDFTTEAAGNACRTYDSRGNSRTDGGSHNRQWCAQTCSDVLIGDNSGNGNTKVVTLPSGLVRCDNTPVNVQEPQWGDTFVVEKVPGSVGTIKVVRTDASTAWGQQLELDCCM